MRDSNWKGATFTPHDPPHINSHWRHTAGEAKGKTKKSRYCSTKPTRYRDTEGKTIQQ